jgi:hypothetical protein
VGACSPVAGARSGGKGGIAWGGRNGARRQAINDRAGARRGGARSKRARAQGGARASGGDIRGRGDRRVGRAGLIRRGLEEEEARLLLFEVRGSLFYWV